MFGKLYIVAAIIRQLYLAIKFLLLNAHHYDIIFIDQLSISIPLLKFFSSCHILFYCHHPDLLLTTRTNILKKLYRFPIDYLEQLTTSQADCIVVNSLYTQQMFHTSFTKIKQKPEILYPAINFKKYDNNILLEKNGSYSEEISPIMTLPSSTILFVSINRYERKKNIGLAIESFPLLRSHIEFRNMKLIIAGGYDPLNQENIEHYPELQQIAQHNNLIISDYPNMSGQVVFLRSFSDMQRSALFHRCCSVLYTPSNEHFGIVPIETMYCQRCIIACNTGGPTESIISGETGYLCDATPESWSSAMLTIVNNLEETKRKGKIGKEHVIKKFSLETFTTQLNQILQSMIKQKQRRDRTTMLWAIVIAVVATLFVSLLRLLS